MTRANGSWPASRCQLPRAASVAERGQIVVITFGVVAFSIFAQGLTMPRLLRRWGLTGSEEAEH